MTFSRISFVLKQTFSLPKQSQNLDPSGNLDSWECFEKIVLDIWEFFFWKGKPNLIAGIHKTALNIWGHSSKKPLLNN